MFAFIYNDYGLVRNTFTKILCNKQFDLIKIFAGSVIYFGLSHNRIFYLWGMKIQYCSDLHLEFSENKRFLEINPIKAHGDILVLAGDIVPFVKLIFSTLWSKIRPAYQWQIERGMSDFHVIKNDGYRFSADKFNQLHSHSLKFITKELNAERSGKVVVATHHVPTFFNYPEKYKGDVLNDAFAVELSDLIEANGPDYWIYGHTHSNTLGFKINNTQLITNQLGYVKYGEHGSFKGEKYFVVI